MFHFHIEEYVLHKVATVLLIVGIYFPLSDFIFILLNIASFL